MSHELRTPMTAILGFAETLLDDTLSEQELLESKRTILRNGRHLLRLVNDILDLSKIEAGRVEVEQTEVNPTALALEVVSLLRVRADRKKIGLSVEFGDVLPSAFETDPLRLRQILTNLLGNAIKFTETGGVRLRIALDDERKTISFSVHDTGIGIDRSKFSRLFEPFSQADTSTTRKFGGTGLGLTISRRLAEMLGGRIEVESVVGEGSTFTVSLPVESGISLVHGEEKTVDAPAPTPRPTRTGLPSLDGIDLLYAEDGPDNRKLVRHFLERAGARVTAVENGRLAVDAVLAAELLGSPFEVILMDMQMPVLDGYGAVRELREQGIETPVIALTAHAMAGDRERCLEAGCDEYSTKPVKRGELISLISSFVHASETEQA